MLDRRRKIDRTWSAWRALLLTAVCLCAALTAGMSGGDLTLDWTDVPGGGSRVSGGTLDLRSSIGQPDAGTLTGGNFTLRGGFWTFRAWLLGDINDDGYVNVGDLQLLVMAWGTSSIGGGGWNAHADLNEDGYINVGDLQILVQNWGAVAG